MKLIKIEIRNNSTGEWRDIPIGKYDSEELDRWPPFHWTEGNYSCDCNRHLKFRRAYGEIGPYDLEEERPCGETEYSIRLTADDGSVYEDERASHTHER